MLMRRRESRSSQNGDTRLLEEEAQIRGQRQNKWRRLRTLGVVLMILSGASLAVLAYLEHWGIFHLKDARKSSKLPVNILPPFFDNRAVPTIISNYVDLHAGMVEQPQLPTSKFLIYDARPFNTTSLYSTFLGLTSAFLLSLVTDRALLVDWDEILYSVSGIDSSSDIDNIYDKTNSSLATISQHLSISSVLQDPGFLWQYSELLKTIGASKTLEDEAKGWIEYEFDVVSDYEITTCEDLKSFFSAYKLVRITSMEYFVPMLLVNPHYSQLIRTSIPSSSLFPYLFNYLIRPVPSVFSAIRRFKERYIDGNSVVAVQMQLKFDHHTMPTTQQNLFFLEARDATYQALRDSAEHGQHDGHAGIMLFVVTDDQEALMTYLQQSGQTSFGAAGVVAITGSSNIQTTTNPLTTSSDTVLPIKKSHDTCSAFIATTNTELQQLWLLGEGSTIITTPGSDYGVLAHSRVGKTPVVIIDGETVHPSTSNQPCLAEIGLVQHASCFVPSMLSAISYDPLVPC